MKSNIMSVISIAKSVFTLDVGTIMTEVGSLAKSCYENYLSNKEAGWFDEINMIDTLASESFKKLKETFFTN